MDMIKDGATLYTPTAPEGKRFLGWYVGDVKYTDLASVGLKNATLYAVFGDDHHNVTFDMGNNETYVQIVDKNGKVLPFTPEKEGYVFEGWVDLNGNAYDFNTALTSDIQLVAKWSEIKSATTENAIVEDAKVDAEEGARLVKANEIAALEALVKGEYVNFITAVDDAVFSVTDGTLGLVDVPIEALSVLGDFSTLPHAGEEGSTLINEINELYKMLTWTDMPE
jgi:uncharacterized repeat protein (TIGR02543 family)